MVRVFCAKCGEGLEPDKLFPGYLCNKCFNLDNPPVLMDNEFYIKICSECYSYSFYEKR